MVAQQGKQNARVADGFKRRAGELPLATDEERKEGSGSGKKEFDRDHDDRAAAGVGISRDLYRGSAPV